MIALVFLKSLKSSVSKALLQGLSIFSIEVWSMDGWLVIAGNAHDPKTIKIFLN
jgi:hypothetical protein